MNELKLIAEEGGVQDTFEKKCMIEFGLNFGVLAIDYVSGNYLNEHVQWLWKQFKRSAETGQLVVDTKGNAIKDEEGFVTYTNLNLG